MALLLLPIPSPMGCFAMVVVGFIALAPVAAQIA
jgi:hypothetical protein